MPTSSLVEDELLYLDPGWQVARGLRGATWSDEEQPIDWAVSGPSGSLVAIAVVRNLDQSAVDDIMLTAAYDLSETAGRLDLGFDEYVVVIEGRTPSGARGVEFDLPRCGRPVTVTYASRLAGVLGRIDAQAQGEGLRRVCLDELLASGNVVSEDLTHC